MKKNTNKFVSTALLCLPVLFWGCGSAPFSSESRSKAIAFSTNGEVILMQGNATLYRDSVKISNPNAFDGGIFSNVVLTEKSILFMRWFSDTQQYVVIERIDYNKISMIKRDEFGLIIGPRKFPYITIGTTDSRFYSFSAHLEKSGFDDFFNFVKSKADAKEQKTSE